MDAIDVSYCTFNQVTFPDFRFETDAVKELASGKLAIKHCRFVRCEVPLSVLLLTEGCVFERCKFVKTPVNKPLYEDVEISLFLKDHVGKDPEFENVTLTITEGDQADAGARVKLTK